jgi:hypothetical protein
MYCNICGHSRFEVFSGRANALCGNCKSTERHRLLVRALFNLNVNFNQLKPDISLIINGNERTDEKLQNCFQNSDLTKLSIAFPILTKRLGSGYNLIVHSHFLNNTDHSWDIVLKMLVEKLHSGGQMIFTLPVDVNRNDNEFVNDYRSLSCSNIDEIKFGNVNREIKLGSMVKFLATSNGKLSHLKYPERELLEISALGVDVFSYIKY